MGKYIRWTDKEVGIFIDLYALNSIDYCSKILGKTPSSIMHMAHRLKLKKNKSTDLIGKTFERLTILNIFRKGEKKRICCECQCICGNIKIIPYDGIKSGHTKSCGCLQKERIREAKFINLIGERSGKIRATKCVGQNKNKAFLWSYICDCGKEGIVSSSNFRNIKSCGCTRREKTAQRNRANAGLNKNCWKKEEDDTLKKFYSNNGSVYISKLLNRTRKSIGNRASYLKLTTKLASFGLPLKTVIEKITENKVLSTCRIHGTAIHYYGNGKIKQCIKCNQIKNAMTMKTEKAKRYNKEWKERYRKTPIGQYKSRIRSEFRAATKGKNGCFRHLPYTAQELTSYLENIKLQQNNLCPICKQSYEKLGFNIEHIIPLAKAKTEKEIIDLFALSNLSLMCPNCNFSKGKKEYSVWMKERKHVY